MQEVGVDLHKQCKCKMNMFYQPCVERLIGFVLFLGLSTANLIQVPQMADLISIITRSFPVGSYGTNVSHDSKDFIRIIIYLSRVYIILHQGTTNLIDLKQISTSSEMDIAPPLTPVNGDRSSYS
ncbi:hypothetical protein Dsin_017843 [Dipteronia sinensis]|uniref:Uncharacterized protein n=1 Tax=Dipteronia sinensis TaxID=43782 RepID=A0AAE0AH44_9ROSI|nr:hypothetical protein Dsin_017843 [Dipteronia sinensis]